MTQQPTLGAVLSDIYIGDDAGIMAAGPRQGHVGVSGVFVRVELPRNTLRRIDAFVAMSAHDAGTSPIRRLMFGHTHVAFPGTMQSFTGAGAVEVWNTGGWVPQVGKPCSVLALALADDGTLRGF